MEVRTDSNNVYYNFNNTNRTDDRIKLDNEPITAVQNQEEQTNTSTNTTDITELPRVELPPEEVRALYTDRLAIQINQEILNGATQNNEVDFASQSVDVSLRDIEQLQPQQIPTQATEQETPNATLDDEELRQRVQERAEKERLEEQRVEEQQSREEESLT